MTAIELLTQLETDLLVSITRNLAKGNIGSAEWQADRLAAFGRVSDELEKTISKNIEAAQAEVSKELQRASSSSVSQIDKAVPASWSKALSEQSSESIRGILASWDRVAAEQINQVGAALLKSSKSAYIDIIEKTTAEVLTGVKTGRQAIAETSRAWSRSGLPALIDSAGRQWSTEAYSQAIIRSNVRNVSTDTQMQRANDWGVDLVEVDSHAGAREGCEPYQGKIYSTSGTSEKYPPLSSTSYGEPDGLFGINCGHSMYPYFPGSKKTYSPMPKKENDQAYQNSQEQRKIERAIRHSKREEAIAKAAGDTQWAARAAEKIKNQQSAMRDFIKDTGRTRRYAREQI